MGKADCMSLLLSDNIAANTKHELLMSCSE